jgi:hypothetical protein
MSPSFYFEVTINKNLCQAWITETLAHSTIVMPAPIFTVEGSINFFLSFGLERTKAF